MNKNRIIWVDIAKYICIMFVMASHLESMTSALQKFYSPFFLTLFFFCSGYTYNHKNDFKAFFHKKIRQLFVPWLAFSVFIILSAQIYSFNSHSSLASELFWNFLQIRSRGDSMWFVAALFVAYIPFYFLIKWYNNKKSTPKRTTLIIVISFLLSLISLIYTKFMVPFYFPWNNANLPWHLEYIFQAMFFMTLGYVFRTKFEATFDSYNSIQLKVLLTLAYLFTIYALPHFFDIQSANFAYSLLYTYFTQLLGTFTIISICKVIKTNSYISYIGQNTLICFGLHGKLLSLIQAIAKKFIGGFYITILENTFTSSIFSMFCTLIISVILIIPIWIMNRYLPFIIGRPFKTKN